MIQGKYFPYALEFKYTITKQILTIFMVVVGVEVEGSSVMYKQRSVRMMPQFPTLPILYPSSNIFTPPIVTSLTRFQCHGLPFQA